MRKMTSAKCLDRRALVGGSLALSATSFLPLPAAAAGTVLLQAVPGTPPGPDFTLPDIDGKPLRFADQKGKVVLVNFWATWCPPCRVEIPSMERAWGRLKAENVVMLAVHVGSAGDQIWEFLSEFNVTFPVLIDKSGKVSKEWQTIGLPTTYVADVHGRRALRAIGGREWDHPELIASILALKA